MTEHQPASVAPRERCDPPQTARLAAALDQWRLAFARGDHHEVERLVQLCRADRDIAAASIASDWIRV